MIRKDHSSVLLVSRLLIFRKLLINTLKESINQKTVESESFVKYCIVKLHERGKLKGLSRKTVVVLTAAVCTLCSKVFHPSVLIFTIVGVRILMNISVEAL